MQSLYVCGIVGTDTFSLCAGSGFVTATSAPQIKVIEKIVKEPIDENNAVVMDLISAGYTVEQSIHAVNKCGTLETALTYLERPLLDEDIDECEAGIIPLQLEREDSQDSLNVDWYYLHGISKIHRWYTISMDSTNNPLY